MAKVSMHIGRNKVCVTHNNRSYNVDVWNKDGHINIEKMKDNVVLVEKPLKEVFKEQFGEAIEKFNQKQDKHPDRKTSVDKYFKEHKKEQVEMIIQFGSETDRPLTDEGYVALYKSYLDKFQKDNPNFIVFGAYIHLDETTPHMHLDYLPVADMSRGMTKKASMEGALGNMGYKRSKDQKYNDTPWKRWEKDTRNNLESFVEFISGCEVEPHEISSKKHSEYWQKHFKDIGDKLSALSYELNGLQEAIERLTPLINGTVKGELVKSIVNDLTERSNGLKKDIEDLSNEIDLEWEGDDYDEY